MIMRSQHRLEKIVQGLFFALLFLLPWQTRYIFSENANQYAQLGIYAYDLVWVVLLIVFIFWWYQQANHDIYWPLVWTVFAFVLFVGASAYWTDHHSVALYYWLHLVQAIITFGIVLTKIISTKHVLQFIVANGSIQALFCIWQSATQYVPANKWLGIAAQSPDISGVSVIATTTGRWLRAYGTLPHPNATAGLLVLAIIAAWILWSQSNSTATRYFASIGAVLAGFGLVLTFSRGAIIVLAICALIILLARLGSSPVVAATIMTMVAASTIYFFIVQHRITTETYTEHYSITERQSQFSEGWHVFSKVWPYGTGIGTYTLENDTLTNKNTPQTQPIHFLPLLIGAETGFIPVILLYGILGWCIIQIRTLSALSVGCTILTLATLGLGLVDHYLWTLPSMLILWWIILSLQYKSGKIFT